LVLFENILSFNCETDLQLISQDYTIKEEEKKFKQNCTCSSVLSILQITRKEFI